MTYMGIEDFGHVVGHVALAASALRSGPVQNDKVRPAHLPRAQSAEHCFLEEPEGGDEVISPCRGSMAPVVRDVTRQLFPWGPPLADRFSLK